MSETVSRGSHWNAELSLRTLVVRGDCRANLLSALVATPRLAVDSCEELVRWTLAVRLGLEERDACLVQHRISGAQFWRAALSMREPELFAIEIRHGCVGEFLRTGA